MQHDNINIFLRLCVPWLAPETCCTASVAWALSSHSRHCTLGIELTLGDGTHPGSSLCSHQHRSSTRDRILSIRENITEYIYIYYGEIEIAFLISPSGKCLWSLQLSWLNLFLRIFAGISKLHRRRNLLVSWLHWITAMVKCWLHRGSSHGCCCNVKLTASHQMLPIVPLSCQIKL